jgi:hypothetical protein
MNLRYHSIAAAYLCTISKSPIRIDECSALFSRSEHHANHGFALVHRFSLFSLALAPMIASIATFPSLLPLSALWIFGIIPRQFSNHTDFSTQLAKAYVMTRTIRWRETTTSFGWGNYRESHALKTHYSASPATVSGGSYSVSVFNGQNYQCCYKSLETMILSPKRATSRSDGWKGGSIARPCKKSITYVFLPILLLMPDWALLVHSDLILIET